MRNHWNHFLHFGFSVILKVIRESSRVFFAMKIPLFSGIFDKILKKWNSVCYENICHTQVSLVRSIGGPCTPLYIDTTFTGGRIAPKENTFYLKLATFGHYVAFFIKVSSAFYYISCSDENDENRGVVLGRIVIYMYFAFSGFVSTGHWIKKHKQLANLLNFLCIFDQLNLGLCNFNRISFMKMIASQAPSLTIGCSGIIAVQQYIQFETPGSLSFPLTTLYTVTNSSLIKLTVKVVNVGITLYEWWNLVWTLALCVLPGFCGLFVSFGLVYSGTKTIMRFVSAY